MAPASTSVINAQAVEEFFGGLLHGCAEFAELRNLGHGVINQGVG